MSITGEATRQGLDSDGAALVTLPVDPISSANKRFQPNGLTETIPELEISETDVEVALRMAGSMLAVGNLGESNTWTTLGLERTSSSTFNQNQTINSRLHTIMSSILMEWNDIQRSISHALSAIQLLEAERTSEDHVIASLQASAAYAAAGASEGAMAYLDAARRSALTGLPNPKVQDLLVREHVAVLLDLGDVSDAMHWTEGFELRTSGDEGESPDIEALQLRLFAALGRTDGLGDKAIRLLKSLRSNASLRTRIEVGTSSAIALEAAGRRAEALVILSTSVQLGETEGFIHAIARHAPRITPLLQSLRHSGPQGRHVWSPAYLDRIIAATVRSETATDSEFVIDLKGSYEPLSDRELQVLRLLNGTLSNREIGAELYLSVNTVKTHVKSVYAKLGVNRRAEAVSRARSLGLLKTTFDDI